MYVGNLIVRNYLYLYFIVEKNELSFAALWFLKQFIIAYNSKITLITLNTIIATDIIR